MSFICPLCGFTTNFESALLMHRQLHHEEPVLNTFDTPDPKKSNSLPGTSSSFFDMKQPNKESNIPVRSSSATRLFGRLRARFSRGNTLFSHPEDPTGDSNQDLCMLSECTSKAFKDELPLTTTRSEMVGRVVQKETFRCHLCSFEANRITILDRHLLDDHKIGLDNLLKLVMVKTKDGLSEESNSNPFSKQPYYKPLEQDQLEEGEFIIETVQPRIKILKHAATNTDNTEMNDNFKAITSELEKMVNIGPVKTEENDFLKKMQTLKDCMCRFEDSYSTLKKMTKEFNTKSRSDRDRPEPMFNLRLGD